MSNSISIFKQAGAVSTASSRGVSALGQSLASTLNTKRIQTNTNGTFRRIINGEQVGNAIRGEFNAIIIDALPKVSRTFYAGKYDPNAKPSLPDCWSNLGDKPEANAGNKQASSCAVCPQNVVGSGDNGKGRACRYQRRVALLLDGDTSGDVYQFNIPAKSLFGKGSGNVHPFESYVQYLLANRESPDTVVTNIAYNLDAETMELTFSPVRGITDEEYELVQNAQGDPNTRNLIMVTVAAADGATKTATAQKQEATKAPAQSFFSEPETAATEEEPNLPFDGPTKRTATTAASEPAPKKNLADVVSAWGDDDE